TTRYAVWVVLQFPAPSTARTETGYTPGVKVVPMTAESVEPDSCNGVPEPAPGSVPMKYSPPAKPVPPVGSDAVAETTVVSLTAFGLTPKFGTSIVGGVTSLMVAVGSAIAMPSGPTPGRGTAVLGVIVARSIGVTLEEVELLTYAVVPLLLMAMAYG